MPKLMIDGNEVEVEAGATVLQACEKLGIEIPRFCYHERLAIAGNCRMCLVEVEKTPKPVASCAMPVAEGMVVHTNSPIVHKARRGVMEFLLINHPLDCPICDQGGECDLQDQAVAYGSGHSRYHEEKRAVPAKDFGPLIKPFMTRCILCTRCVRFLRDVAGVPELGGTGRGEHVEIGTYVQKALSSELSGNIIDLCPVGALTSRPYQYKVRPWELRKTETIDVLDAVGSNIRVDVRGRQVLRVLPRLNEDVNEEWISDKTRFACDGLSVQRLDRPYVRDASGRLQAATWDEAFAVIAAKLKGMKGSRIAAIAGDLADAEAMVALKDLMTSLGSENLDCRQDGARLNATARGAYLFNTTIAGIEEADACLLIGTNPRHEASLINARLRKRYLRGGFKVAAVGPDCALSYPCEWLGDKPSVLVEIASGKHDFAKVLQDAEHPMLIIGQGALARTDGAALFETARTIAANTGMISDEWNGFNVLHMAAARVGGLDLGFVPGSAGRDVEGILAGAESEEIEAVYLLGADEIAMDRLGTAFVIYQGHHGDAGAHRADVILPGAAYTEKDATYVNTEGRVQRTQVAVFPPGDAREDWKILRALSAVLGRPLPYNSAAQVRDRLVQVNAVFAADDRLLPATWDDYQPVSKPGKPGKMPLMSGNRNFYMSDPISRASKTMAECSALFMPEQQQKTGNHG